MECQICYEILESNTNICITKCRHRFCSQCIFTWIRKNQTCPVCRKNLFQHDDACPQIDPRQSSFSARRQYQNNFIQFLKNNVLSQHFMDIRLVYKKFLQEYIHFERRTSSNWRHDVKNMFSIHENIIRMMSLDTLRYSCENELYYDNHPSTVFEKVRAFEDCQTETERRIFHEIFLECLYLYNRKNNNDESDFSNLISVHDDIIAE